jgi:hypothetical protein
MLLVKVDAGGKAVGERPALGREISSATSSAADVLHPLLQENFGDPTLGRRTLED